MFPPYFLEFLVAFVIFRVLFVGVVFETNDKRESEIVALVHSFISCLLSAIFIGYENNEIKQLIVTFTLVYAIYDTSFLLLCFQSFPRKSAMFSLVHHSVIIVFYSLYLTNTEFYDLILGLQFVELCGCMYNYGELVSPDDPSFYMLENMLNLKLRIIWVVIALFKYLPYWSFGTIAGMVFFIPTQWLLTYSIAKRNQRKISKIMEFY